MEAQTSESEAQPCFLFVLIYLDHHRYYCMSSIIFSVAVISLVSYIWLE
jgi:hypothetical protein